MPVTNLASNVRAFAQGEGQLSTTGVLAAHLLPLLHRIKRGEGQLLAINISLAIASRPTPVTFVTQGVLAGLVLTLLYFVNDVIDAPRDVRDPGKDQEQVRFLLTHRSYLSKLLAVEHVALPVLALVLQGIASAVAVVGVLAVNLAYSRRLKGWAFLDVPWVALWGSLYALCTGIAFPFQVYAVVGLMTGITHVFQMKRDRHVDALNAIETSAVAKPWLPALQMAIACAAMAFCWGTRLGWLAGASAVVPLLLFLTLRSNQWAWLLAKAHFGVLWLLLLSSSYEL